MSAITFPVGPLVIATTATAPAAKAFMFGNLDRASLPPNWPVPDGGSDRALSDAMIDYWTGFARTGVPRSAAAAWPAYGASAAYLHLANWPRPGTALLAGRYALHEEVVSRRRRAGDQMWMVNVGVAAAPLSVPR